MTEPDWPLLRTPLCDLLGCDVPILLAGMGGVARWELAAAVAGAGGYPTLGMVREPPALIESEVLALRAATPRSFAVNVIPAATEYRLLEHLMGNPGRVYSREQLLDRVWGSDVYVDERTVDVHVGRLRKAINRGRQQDPIRTVRGAGYSFDEQFAAK